MQVQADLPVGASRLCSGARRSFFFRMKYNKIPVKVEEKEPLANSSKKKGEKPDNLDGFWIIVTFKQMCVCSLMFVGFVFVSD